MKTAIVFWSGTGNTEAMAQTVANGVKAAGAEVDLYNLTFCWVCTSILIQNNMRSMSRMFLYNIC